MDLIVLDTIHGGLEIARALSERGYRADPVDVYRGSYDPDPGRHYDHVVAPVHLDPDNKVFRLVKDLPLITHHEATGWIIGSSRPAPMIEVTGARGKTTTACAIAHQFKTPGILHTSCGTFRYPDRSMLWRKSITPASLIAVADYPGAREGWLVAEESLGVTGVGDVAVLTSAEDYPCAGGKKSALALKRQSMEQSPIIIASPGVQADLPQVIHVEDHIRIEGSRCFFDLNGVTGSFENSLLGLSAYAGPLMTAAATGCMLGISPESLASFPAIAGRMAVSRENGHIVIDNANSGTSAKTTIEAADYAKVLSGGEEFILVTGQESRAVCEGFPPGEIAGVINDTRPSMVYLVGTPEEHDAVLSSVHEGSGCEIVHVPKFEDARTKALERNDRLPVVFAVKSWR